MFFNSPKMAGRIGHWKENLLMTSKRTGRTCKFRLASNHIEGSVKSEDSPTSPKLYETHIPTTCFQKTLLTIGSAGMALYSPYRDDMVAVLGETTGHAALKQIHSIMLNNEEGRQVLRDRPRINSQTIDLQYLTTLKEDTFGKAYFRFLETNKVSPDTRMPVHFVDDDDLAYVMQRYREAHDLLHTVLGMPTNMLGEVAVKWVESMQTGLPMCTMGAMFGPLRFSKKQRQTYITSVLPWAIRCGYRSKFLLNLYFEKRWEEQLVCIRDEMKIEPPPVIPQKKTKTNV